MNPRKLTWLALSILAIGFGCATASWSLYSDTWTPTVPVTVLVSVEAKHGKEVPTIYKEDVRVLANRNRLPAIDWIPCQGDQAGLELLVLIDDSSTVDVGLQLDDIRKFINGQPETTLIAVGYIRNGTVEILQNFSKDHASAAKALRLPMGTAGGMASPYTAITELSRRWRKSGNRREIFMVSSGIDALQPGPDDSYLDQAIDSAQRAGIQIYSIYASAAGHSGHTLWRFSFGQNNLSRLADETGAEAYFQALQMPISYAPYLNEFSDRLQHQFWLTFLAKPAKKAGFQKIRLETEVPNAELVAADSVYIPAAK